MSFTQQSQAIAIANTVITLGAQVSFLYDQITSLNNSWNDSGALGVIQHLPTAALNADGSLGAADVSPVLTNPIDVRVNPVVGQLLRAVSSSDITSILTQLNDIVSYINGDSLPATPGVRSVFNKVRDPQMGVAKDWSQFVGRIS